MKKYKEKIAIRIVNHCRTMYEPLSHEDMVLGRIVYNARCHLNAVQAVKEGKAKDVYMCICTDKDSDSFVHFINKDNDGKYVDNTLGWQYEELFYYVVRKIHPTEYPNIGDILMGMKRELVFKHSNSFMRKLFKIKYSDIV